MTAFQKSSADRNIEIIKEFYSRLNQNKVDSVMNLLDTNVIRAEAEFLSGRTYQGHAEMREHIVSGRNTWAEGSCSPVEFFNNGNKTIVMVHVRVRLKNETKWLEGQTADGFAINDGLVTEFHTFASKEKAFEWAGLKLPKVSG